MSEIDLGRNLSDSMAVPSQSSEEGDSTFYPCLYIDNVQGMDQLPDSGTMTIRYRKKNSSTRTDHDSGEESQSVCIEVEAILDAKGGSEDKDKMTNEDDREDQLDKFAEEEVAKSTKGASAEKSE